MDTITHGIVGALVGKAFFAGHDVPAGRPDVTLSRVESSPGAGAAIMACTIGSIFPDIDIFAGQIARNPLAIMEWHRSITHSLLVLPVWALLLTVISLPVARSLRWQAPAPLKLFLIYAVGLLSHIFLDLVTSFGTMVWSPLKYSRPAWDWIFILDLTLTALALVPQLAAWCYRNPKHFKIRIVIIWIILTVGALGGYELAASAGYGFSIVVVSIASVGFAIILFAPTIRNIGFGWNRANWCRVGLAFVCAYLALASFMHRKALADIDHFAEAHHLPNENRGAFPLPPTLTHWAGLISTPDGVWRTTLYEPSGAIEHTQFYSDAESDPYVKQAKKLHDVQVYLWFARFPIWQVKHQGDQTIVDVSDVRFFREDDPTVNVESRQPKNVFGIRTNPAGFTFEIVFDTDGNAVPSGFKKP